MGAPARPAASRMHTTSSARLAPKRRTLDEDGCWQDCEIRFDAKLRSITPRGGECVIDRMEHIEDTKGNNGESGQLLVTNLRIIWVCERKKRTNLSIGHDAIVSMQIRSAESRLRGTTQALYVMTHFNDARFEFVFTNLVRGSPRLFTTMQAVYEAYDTSRLYRELKLRGAIIKDGALELLPREEIVSTANKVWNLAADSQSLGTYVVTNVRLVWHAEKAQSYNASLPYVQMRSIALRESKFGRTLVIELTKRAGGYVLGFRADTETKLKVAHTSRKLTRKSKPPAVLWSCSPSNSFSIPRLRTHSPAGHIQRAPGAPRGVQRHPHLWRRLPDRGARRFARRASCAKLCPGQRRECR